MSTASKAKGALSGKRQRESFPFETKYVTTENIMQEGAEQLTKRQKREWMHKRFRENELAIVSMLEGLFSVNANTGTTEIHTLLDKLDQQIERMCWVFIDFHKVFEALKCAKQELRTRGEDMSSIGRLKERLEAQYNENSQLYPSILPQQLCPASYLRNNVSSQMPSTATLKSRNVSAPTRTNRHGKVVTHGIRREADVVGRQRVLSSRNQYVKSAKARLSTLPLTSREKSQVFKGMTSDTTPRDTAAPLASLQDEGATKPSAANRVANDKAIQSCTSKQTHESDEVFPDNILHLSVFGRSRLHHEVKTGSAPKRKRARKSAFQSKHGKTADERALREWLDLHGLWQSTGAALMEIGARCVDDVGVILRENPDLLNSLSAVDQQKLKKTFHEEESIH